MTAGIRDLAISLAARHRVPELIAARNARAEAVAATTQELAAADRSVTIWQRMAFFYDSPDEKKVGELRQRLEEQNALLAAAQQEVDTSFEAVWGACPAVEIAQRVEAVITTAIAQRAIARGAEEDDKLARELEALGARVLAIWAPGIDADALERTLGEDQARAAAAAQRPGAPRPHATLGWEPIAQAELLNRAAVALEASGFATARAGLAVQQAEYGAMAARLEEAEGAVTIADRLWPAESEREKAVSWLQTALSKEQQDVVVASENVLHALERSLGAYPPLAIQVAAQTAAGALRAGLARSEHALTSHGTLGVQPAAYLRAFFLAGLVELRRAAEAAFPGVPELVSGRGGERDRRDLEDAARDRGPYRRAIAAADEPAPAPRAHGSEAAFFAELDRWPLRTLAARALAHATLLGALQPALEEASARVGVLDRLAFWKEGDDAVLLDALAERQRWHRAVLESLGHSAMSTIMQAGSAQPLLMLQAYLVEAHVAVTALHTHEGGSSTSRSCPVFGKERALKAVEALAGHLSRHYGMAGTRDQLISDLRRALHGAAGPTGAARGQVRSHEQIVTAFAEALRPTAFAALVDRIEHSRTQHSQASHAATAAEQQVTFLDKVNVFSDSAAERARDHSGEAANAWWEAMRSDIGQVNTLLDGVFPTYPPAQLYYALERVHAQVEGVNARSYSSTTTTKVGNSTITRTTYYCRIEGRDAALAALQGWTRAAIAVFGALPSASEVLERWVQRDLVP